MDDDEVVKKKCSTCNTTISADQEPGPACLDYKKTVIAQYSNSPVLLQLLDYIDQNIKVCGFFDDFYRVVWNINTAEGFGLDIWGIIVGVTRKVRTFMGVYWGFYEESLLIARPYFDITGYNMAYSDQPADKRSLYDPTLSDEKQSEQYYGAVGMFRDLQGQQGDGKDLMQDYIFDDYDFRKLILAKAYANISNYSITNINFLLMALLSENKYCTGCCNTSEQNNGETTCISCGEKREIYIQDNLNMSLTVKLNWLPTQREVALIYNTGLLSRPAGVEMYEIDIQVNEVKEN